MAVTSFHQSCPTCGHKNYIDTPRKIGKKISCENCAAKFQVEAPVKAAAAAKAGRSPKAAKGGKSSADDNAAKVKKGKKGKKNKPDKKKEGGKNNMIIVGALLGVIAVGGLIAAIVLMGDDDKPKSSGGGGSRASNTNTGGTPATNTPPGGDEPGGGGGETETNDAGQEVLTKKAAQKAASGNITNYLPGNTQLVAAVNPQVFAGSVLGNNLRRTYGDYNTYFSERTGFQLRQIERFIVGLNLEEGEVTNVIRFRTDFDKAEMTKALTKALKIIDPPRTQGEYQYLRGAKLPLMDDLRDLFNIELRAQGLPEIKRPGGVSIGRAVYIIDNRTIIIAKESWIQEFLNNGQKFALRSQVLAKPKPQPKQPDGEGGEGNQGGEGQEGVSGSGSGGAGASIVYPPGQGPPDNGRPTGGNAGPKKKKEKEEPAEVPDILISETPTYLTIDPRLKAVLDRLNRKVNADRREGDDQEPLLVMATDTRPAAISGPLDAARLFLPDELAELKNVRKPDFFGFAVTRLDDERVTGYFGIDCNSDRTADVWEDASKNLILLVADPLRQFLGHDIDLGAGAPPPSPTEGVGGGGGNFGEREGQEGVGGGAPPVAGAGTGGGAGAGAPPVAGAGTGGGGGGAGIGVPRPGTGGGTGNGTETPKKDQPKSKISFTREGKRLAAKMELSWKDVYGRKVRRGLRGYMIAAQGRAAMGSGQARWPELAGTVDKAGNGEEGFPPAALVRRVGGNSLGLQFPPSKRVSWLVRLLPHMGQRSLADRVEESQSWDADPNLRAGETWVPQFLDPAKPPETWRATPAGVSRALGATHFVGVAGVGMGSAYYPAGDKRNGLIGHDRRVKLPEITDGTANTFFMLQVPPTFQRPWIHGGAAVSGVPETKSVAPFVASEYDGKKGTFALMADGSVRFIRDDVADTVFKAMATHSGGDEPAVGAALPGQLQEVDLDKLTRE